MRLGNTDPFYRVSSSGMWGDINLRELSLSDLDKAIDEGRKYWKQTHPPKKGFNILQALGTVALVVLSAGAASMAIGALSSAGGGIAATLGRVVNGAKGLLSGQKALGLVKAGTEKLVHGAQKYTELTGKETPADLLKAADAIEKSSSWTDAGKKAFQYYMEQSGQEVTDPKQLALIDERLRREQQYTADAYRQQAARLADQEAQKKGDHGWLAVAIPAGLLLVGSML